MGQKSLSPVGSILRNLKAAETDLYKKQKSHGKAKSSLNVRSAYLEAKGTCHKLATASGTKKHLRYCKSVA